MDAGAINNTATAHGKPPTGADVTSTDTDTVTFTPAPAITIDKTDNATTSTGAGDTITYSFKVTNTGNVTLNPVTVTDPLSGLSAITCPVSVLAPAATTTCMATYVVKQSDVNAGVINNTATAHGTPPTGSDVTSTDTDVVTLTQTPDLASVKQLLGYTDADASTTVSVGDTLHFKITVSNIGNTTLTNVTVTDTLTLTNITGTSPCASVAPGSTCTLLGDYVVQPADAAAGHVLNAAVVTDDKVCTTGSLAPKCNPSVNVPMPVVSMSKTLSSENGSVTGVAEPGETLVYKITLTNTGDADATGYGVTDPLDSNVTYVSSTTGGVNTSGTVTWSNLTVPANGSLVLTVTVTVNNSIPAGVSQIANLAYKTGSTETCASAPAQCVTIPLQPKVSVAKTADPVSGSTVTAGQQIEYTLTATVAHGPTTDSIVLHDTLGAHLTVVTPLPTGCTNVGQTITCTVASGKATGSYPFVYSATVDQDAIGTVHNGVVIDSTHGGGDPDPQCTSCTTTHDLSDPTIVYSKSSNPASGSTVNAGDTITYTLTATVSKAALTAPLVLTDTLTAGETFGSVTSLGGYTLGGTGQVHTFTLPSGTVPGTYAVTYTATVNQDA
ncbi:MAG TPA: hypothetical protein VFN13_02385, partial [Rudaea sp.]|nr:hypothetical protein [Rudaea sp.]